MTHKQVMNIVSCNDSSNEKIIKLAYKFQTCSNTLRQASVDINVTISNNGKCCFNSVYKNLDHSKHLKSIISNSTYECDLFVKIPDSIMLIIKQLGFFSDLSRNYCGSNEIYIYIPKEVDKLKYIKYNCILDTLDIAKHLAVEPDDIKYVDNPTDDHYIASITSKAECAKLIPSDKYDLIKLAIDCNIEALNFIDVQNEDICRYAIKKNIKALDYIKDQKLKDTLMYETQQPNNDCCICFQIINKKFALVPCGHSCFCDACYRKLFNNSNRCPICNAGIDTKLDIFL